LTNVVNKIST